MDLVWTPQGWNQWDDKSKGISTWSWLNSTWLLPIGLAWDCVSSFPYPFTNKIRLLWACLWGHAWSLHAWARDWYGVCMTGPIQPFWSIPASRFEWLIKLGSLSGILSSHASSLAHSEPAKCYSPFMPWSVRFHVDKWELFPICRLFPSSLYVTGYLEIAVLFSSGPHPVVTSSVTCTGQALWLRSGFASELSLSSLSF